MNVSKIVTGVLVSLTGVVAALIAHGAIQGRQEAAAIGGGAWGAAPRAAVVVQATELELGRIENSVVINGDILARNQVAVFPAVGGRLVETRLGIGDWVRAGSVVAMVDPSRPGEVFSLSPVVSPVSGTVLQAPLSVGDTVTASSALYVVGDLSSLRIETFVPERFVSAVSLGLGASIALEALPGEIFYARVDEINPVLDPLSRTLRIRLHFVDAQGRAAQDPRIRAGMFATVTLVTSARDNAPIMPRDAAIRTQGEWVAFVVDEDGIARRRALELGMESELFVEVLSGISLGEKVVSAGQNFLEDGDPVRVVE